MVTSSVVERALCRAGAYRPARTLYQRLLKPSHHDERRALARMLRPLVPRGGLVFDVGANRGDMTALFLGLGAQVVAVEPTPALARLISGRYRSRHLTVETCAIGATVGRLPLNLGRYDEHSTLSEQWRTLAPERFDGTIEVPVLTLDDLIAVHGVPDFAKIDVEGFELEVLTGLGQPVPALSFEFRDALADTTRGCLEMLLSLGPYRFSFDPLGEWTDSQAIMAAIEALDEETSGDIYARLDDQARA
jgi:FkbM family methyltransferase